MSASLVVSTKSLDRLAERFADPAVRAEIEALPEKKAVAAMVGQAIADNFDKQGPGWKPLSHGTIRRSVGKQVMARKATKDEPHRMILQKTGLLKKAATTPGAAGNIWKREGHKLIWGVDLVYAGIHNNGGVIKHPGTNNGFGIKGLKIPPHNITIPKRQFLTIRSEWMMQIKEYLVEQIFKVIQTRVVKS